MKAIIDLADNILYGSYYVYALESVFGRKNVSFSSTAFSELSLRKKGAFCFLIETGDGKQKRYVVSHNDSAEIITELYDWCDVYGSVNANFAKTPEKYHGKLVALCPSFGIRCWNLPQTVVHVVSNMAGTGNSLRKRIGKYKRMLQRPMYEDYHTPPLQSINNQRYVFFLSTLWYNDDWNKNDEGVNGRRANFIRVCKELECVDFEGGLVSQGKDRSSEELFSDCLCKGIPMKEWMEKTKQSILVFNTPAFWDCHGWKLGEYLAMGKCIVSTPLSNDLPAPLEHGKNIHFVENTQESMSEAVEYIINNPEYRKKLEMGAREYWERYGAPAASLKLLGIKV